jgi:hypothetical protein
MAVTTSSRQFQEVATRGSIGPNDCFANRRWRDSTPMHMSRLCTGDYSDAGGTRTLISPKPVAMVRGRQSLMWR